MNWRGKVRNYLAVALAMLFGAAAPQVALAVTTGAAGDELARRATWEPPSAEEAERRVGQWLAIAEPDAARRETLMAAWQRSTEGWLDRTLALIGQVEPRAQEVAQYCALPTTPSAPPEFAILRESPAAPFVVHHLRLQLGRYLAQRRLFDEAAVQLDGLEPADVLDPACLLFFQGLAHHALVEREAGLDALSRLLERRGELPRRYRSLTELMVADLKQLKDEESLDHIARRMDDVRRRLDLAREEPKVRSVEDGIVQSLDKLIDKIEDQQRQQQASAQAMPQGSPQNPLDPLHGKLPPPMHAPGDVAPKKLDSQGGWGQLPPKQRQEALQQIGKEFPAHYRDIIEQYFRKQAADSE